MHFIKKYLLTIVIRVDIYLYKYLEENEGGSENSRIDNFWG